MASILQKLTSELAALANPTSTRTDARRVSELLADRTTSEVLWEADTPGLAGGALAAVKEVAAQRKVRIADAALAKLRSATQRQADLTAELDRLANETPAERRQKQAASYFSGSHEEPLLNRKEQDDDKQLRVRLCKQAYAQAWHDGHTAARAWLEQLRAEALTVAEMEADEERKRAAQLGIVWRPSDSVLAIVAVRSTLERMLHPGPVELGKPLRPLLALVEEASR